MACTTEPPAGNGEPWRQAIACADTHAWRRSRGRLLAQPDCAAWRLVLVAEDADRDLQSGARHRRPVARCRSSRRQVPCRPGGVLPGSAGCRTSAARRKARCFHSRHSRCRAAAPRALT